MCYNDVIRADGPQVWLQYRRPLSNKATHSSTHVLRVRLSQILQHSVCFKGELRRFYALAYVYRSCEALLHMCKKKKNSCIKLCSSRKTQRLINCLKWWLKTTSLKMCVELERGELTRPLYPASHLYPRLAARAITGTTHLKSFRQTAGGQVALWVI